MRLYDELSSAYPTTHIARVKPEELWLAERCALTHEGHWLVKDADGSWAMQTTKACRQTLEQHWLGGLHRITKDDILAFIKESAPVVTGGMKVPTTDAVAIRFGDGVYVNTWHNTIMSANPVAANDLMLRQPLHTFLRMLRESLCGKPDTKTIEEMITIANGEDPEEIEFRFLMMWLAAPIQRVGLNLQTNLWLLGELNGAGRGTLNRVMARIYGADNAVSLNCDEVDRGGWTDCLEGKLWVNFNELNAQSMRRFDWNAFIKQNSTEDIITIRKRCVHSHPAVNFANWNFTTNNEGPTCLDAFDRRNFLCATTNNPAKAALAQEFRDWMNHNPDSLDAMLGAFVHLLHIQHIDHKLMERAPDTCIKQEVQDATSHELEYVYWLKNDDDYPRDQWLKANEYLTYYLRFAHKSDDRMTPRRFGGQLSKLARKKYIERQNPHGETNASYYRIKMDKFPTELWRQRHGTSADNPVSPPKLALVSPQNPQI